MGMCNCFISNPNEHITLDIEIEREKKRVLLQSPYTFEDNTTHQKQLLKPEDLSDIKKNYSIDSCSFKKEISISILSEINEARSNPTQYAEKMSKYLDYINTTNNNNQYYLEFNNQKIYFDQGKQVFYDCIEYLNETESVPKLKMVEDLLIEIPYEQLDQCNNESFKKNLFRQIKKEVGEKYSRLECIVNKSVNCSEIAAMIMIIDNDDGNELHLNRKMIFNSKMRHVGISCFNIDENVICCYVLFGEINKDYDEGF